MDIQIIDIGRAIAALLIGGVIGLGFGTLQAAALRQNEERERTGALKSGWSIMPRSGARVAYLLITLVVIQVVCPMLFADGTQWWVSGGVLAGYSWHLVQRLRRRRAELR
jgi:hypothetical protein